MADASPPFPSTLQHTLSTHRGPVNALAFSNAGGTYLLTGSSDREVHLVRTLLQPSDTKSTTNSITHSPSSQTSSPPTSTTPIQKYTAHGYALSDLSCAPDNQTFASAGGDRLIMLWDVSRALTLRRFGSSGSSGGNSGAHTARVNCVRFAGASGSVVVSGSDDRRVLCWDARARDPRPVCEMGEARDGIGGIWCPEPGEGSGEAMIVAGGVDGRVRWYDLRMGCVKTDVMPAGVVSVEGTRDGKVALVGVLDSSVRMIDSDDGKCLRTFQDPGFVNAELRLKSCLAGEDETWVLSGSEADGAVRAWDTKSGRVVQGVQVSEAGKVVSVVKWRPGDKRAGVKGVWAAGAADGVVRVYG